MDQKRTESFVTLGFLVHKRPPSQSSSNEMAVSASFGILHPYDALLGGKFLPMPHLSDSTGASLQVTNQVMIKIHTISRCGLTKLQITALD